MNDIEDFQWSNGSNEVSWRHRGRDIVKFFASKVGHVLQLRDNTGVVVVEDASCGGIDNASIWNLDGRLRCRPKNPFDKNSDMVFYYSEYSGSALRIILAGRSRDFWFYLDETSCSLNDKHEAR